MTLNSIPRLGTIYFYLTEGCNLACKHCWLSPPLEKGELKHAYLPVADFQTVIREAKPLGLNTVKLTGGEPLLHPDILEILRLIAEEKLNLTIETNGTLLTDEIAEAIALIEYNSVSISLDSTSASIHDSIRNSPGCFDRTISGIKTLVRHGISPQIITSLLPENKDDIIGVLNLATTLQAGSFKLNIVQPTQRGEQLMKRGDTVLIPEILRITSNLFENHCEESGIRISVTIPFAFRPLNRLYEGHTSRCGIMTILGVLPSGEYALCGIGSSIQELVFGRVGRDSLESIWHEHPVLVELRSNLPKDLEGICGECTMKSICLGSCIAQNYYESKRLTAPFWFCKAADEAGLFPASRKLPTAT